MDWVGARGWLLVVALMTVLLPASTRGQVVINEVMADNATSLENETDFPDWVEFYNTTAGPVDIGGWFFSNILTNISKFKFPVGTVIPGNGFLVVFCDNATNSPGLHTRFNLSANGSFLGLYQSGGLLVDMVTYGVQVTDYSVGRVPDGAGGVGAGFSLNLSTPGTNNVMAALGVRRGNLFINEWLATNSPTITVTNNGSTLVTNVEEKSDWLELYNDSTNAVNLAGLILTTYNPPISIANKPITNLSYIGPKGFVKFDCVGSGKANQADELDFKLSNSEGELVTMYGGDGVTILDQIAFPGYLTVPGYWLPDISYGRLPDGSTNGYTVNTSCPFPYTGCYGTCTNWARFSKARTTPGKSNLLPLTNVVVSEVLAHTDPPFEDAIELFNPTPNSVDLGGFWISNDKDNPKKFRIPFGTILPPYGFTNFYECVGCAPGAGFNWNGLDTSPTFTLNSARGDAVYVFSANAAGDLTGFRADVDFDSSDNGVSFGRYTYISYSTNYSNSIPILKTNVETDFVPMSRTTFGSDNPFTVFEFRQGKGLSNAYPQMGPLAITEVHYHPPDIIIGITNLDDSLNEFVELYNASPNPVPLWDTNGLYYDIRYFPTNDGVYADGRTNTWHIRGDISYDFPTNVTLGSGRYLILVNFDPVTNLTQLALFTSKFAVPPDVPIFGAYRGKLANSSSQIEIKQADSPQGFGRVDFKYVPYFPMERVKYNDSSPWPTNADGRGFSLNRVKVEEYGNNPTNWVAFLPTPGRQNLQIEAFDFDRTNNRVTLRFHGLAYSSYSIAYASSPTGDTWTKLPGTNVPAQTTSGVRQVIFTAPAGVNRFYRIACPQ
jgi:hypothetical protein